MNDEEYTASNISLKLNFLNFSHYIVDISVTLLQISYNLFVFRQTAEPGRKYFNKSIKYH